MQTFYLFEPNKINVSPKLCDLCVINPFTTTLLSNATGSLLKAMKICYGKVSDQPFRRRTCFFMFSYKCN